MEFIRVEIMQKNVGDTERSGDGKPHQDSPAKSGQSVYSLIVDRGSLTKEKAAMLKKQ